MGFSVNMDIFLKTMLRLLRIIKSFLLLMIKLDVQHMRKI